MVAVSRGLLTLAASRGLPTLAASRGLPTLAARCGLRGGGGKPPRLEMELPSTTSGLEVPEPIDRMIVPAGLLPMGRQRPQLQHEFLALNHVGQVRILLIPPWPVVPSACGIVVAWPDVPLLCDHLHGLRTPRAAEYIEGCGQLRPPMEGCIAMIANGFLAASRLTTILV